MFGSALFFFTIFPYILNDKFIFPKDTKMKPYSGFGFIWENLSYRWETILLAWLLVVANITKKTFDTKEDLQAKVLNTNGLKANVRFDSGSKSRVNTSELSIDPDSYLTVNSRVEINTNPLGTNKLIGVIRKIDTIDDELVYTIFVEHKNKPDETLKAIKHSNITPIVNKENEKKIRKNTRVIVNSKSTAGSIASKAIYLIALGWLIWIIFRHKASYVVLSVLLFTLKFIIENSNQGQPIEVNQLNVLNSIYQQDSTSIESSAANNCAKLDGIQCWFIIAYNTWDSLFENLNSEKDLHGELEDLSSYYTDGSLKAKGIRETELVTPKYIEELDNNLIQIVVPN